MAVTAKRGDMRLLAVVLGEETAAIRNEETSALLDYGFQNYQIQVLKKKTDVLERVKLDNANKKEVVVVPSHDVTVLLKKNESLEDYEYQLDLGKISLPLSKGGVIGKFLVIQNGNVIKEIDAVSNEDVGKLGFIRMWANFFKYIVIGRL